MKEKLIDLLKYPAIALSAYILIFLLAKTGILNDFAEGVESFRLGELDIRFTRQVENATTALQRDFAPVIQNMDARLRTIEERAAAVPAGKASGGKVAFSMDSGSPLPAPAAPKSGPAPAGASPGRGEGGILGGLEAPGPLAQLSQQVYNRSATVYGDIAGYIFIGNYSPGGGWTQAKIHDPRTGALAGPPQDIRPDASYVLDGNMYVRASLPPDSPEYFRAVPSLGVLPRGATVTILETPQGIDRESAVQYWARVRVAN